MPADQPRNRTVGSKMTEVAGVAAAGNWNPEQGASGSATGLVDSTGSSTTAQASWTADNPWAESITDQPGNYRLMLGYLDNGEESTTTVAVSGLPSSSGGYNVYVYANGGTTGWNTGTYQISGTGITTTSIGLTYTSNFNGTFTQANNSVGNYVVFTIPNVSGFTLSAIPGAASSGYERAPVNGIQIVPIGGEGGGGTVANPSISPVSGSYVSPQTITVSDATSGATICVRTDGGAPTASTPGTCDSPATAFSSGGNFSLTIPSGGATVEALGTLAGYTNSGVATNSYSLAAQAGQPGFSPAAGTYTSTQTVTISASSGAIICWNTTGSPGPINGGSTCPAGSTLINGSSGTITVSSSETVYAVAGGSGYSDSSLGSASYTLNLGPQVYYYIEGSLGTARVMTDSTGNVCYDADFYPFGGERVVTGSCPQNYKFTGKERDTESGLDNFTARYYSSQFGRFMSPDWSDDPDPVPYADFTDPQTLNLYSYVRNNPLTFKDPDGHACVTQDDGTYIDDDSGGQSCADAALQNQNGGQKVYVNAPDLDDELGPYAVAVAQGTQMAAPAVNLAYNGLKLFGNIVSFGSMTAAECLAGDPDCTKTSIGLAALPMLGPLSEELGVSIRNLKHIMQHLPEFAALDSSLDLKGIVQLGQDVKETGTQVAPNAWVKTVQIGQETVQVKAVVNSNGVLRSVYILNR